MSTLKNFTEIADEYLKRSGYFNNCRMLENCREYYDISKCSLNNCQLLKDIKTESVPKKLWNYISELISFKEKEGSQLICPRSIQSHSKIIKRCDNKSCHFYSTTMAFHCMLLHGKAFFPDEDLPRRVKEVCTGLNEKRLSEYEDIIIYLMRVYLILFKYGIENLKMEYRISEFQTKYIYKFLECVDGTIETCPRCGAIIKSRVCKKVKIGNSSEYYVHNEAHCLCEDQKVFEKRMEVIEAWRKILENNDYSEKILNSSYRRFNSIIDEKVGKIQFMRFLLSKFNFDGLYLKQLPIGYVLRAYKILFGKFIPANFGLSRKSANLLINLFDEEQAV